MMNKGDWHKYKMNPFSCFHCKVHTMEGMNNIDFSESIRGPSGSTQFELKVSE
jgi:hypothetical protein